MEFVLVVVALVLAAGIAFGIVVLVTGNDPGLVSTGTDRLPEALPADRPLSESDVIRTRFDTSARGYRTVQVDEALSRVAYDVGFKDELIKVLASEVTALRDGRTADADALQDIRRRALGESADDAGDGPAVPDPSDDSTDPEAATESTGDPGAAPESGDLSDTGPRAGGTPEDRREARGGAATDPTEEP